MRLSEAQLLRWQSPTAHGSAAACMSHQLHVLMTADLRSVCFGDIARSDFVVSLPLVYKGTHYAHPKVTVSQGADVFAASAGGEGARAVEIEADGEIVGALPARFSVLPEAITLIS